MVPGLLDPAWDSALFLIQRYKPSAQSKDTRPREQLRNEGSCGELLN